MDIDGRQVLLTGANGGLGQAIARELHGIGARLVLSGRRPDQLQPVADELGAEVVLADLTDRADVERICADVGRFDVVVANAGVGSSMPPLDISAAEIDALIDINLRTPMLLATSFAAQRAAAGLDGHLVAVGSLAGIAASPGTSLYNATKFGLRGFALAFSQDLDGTGVGMSIVEPGFIRDAGMFARNSIDLPPGVRTKSPEDVAHAVVRAIRTGRIEVFASPPELRLLSTVATVVPGFSAAVQRRLGVADRVDRAAGS